MRFVVLGAGFWTPFQLCGWKELENPPECVGIWNRSRDKAESLAAKFGIPHVGDDPRRLLEELRPDFVDIVTAVEAHADHVRLAIELGIPVICQKPMTTDIRNARDLVGAARKAGVWFGIHENWRFQAAIRAVAGALASGEIGRAFRARIQFSNSFPVFENQPFLAELERFILTDIGSHILDTARCLFGDARSLLCHTARANPHIRGEDVATVLMSMERCPTVVCEMSYASRLKDEHFPETFVVVEGDQGSVELRKDGWLHITTAAGTRSTQVLPKSYAWADPAYLAVHSSIVDCNASLLGALQADVAAETSAEDNLKTVALVWAAYESADTGRLIHLKEFTRP